MYKIELNLTEEELKNLINVLEKAVSDLSMEIADTDSMDYREKLKSERKSFQKVLNQLKDYQQE
ncbi:MAG: hypothetical protein P8Z50_07285 [candidate division WOR-3 bacterium]|jgi:DNA-binding transcriptional regulator GbsR (MarR family)